MTASSSVCELAELAEPEERSRKPRREAGSSLRDGCAGRQREVLAPLPGGRGFAGAQPLAQRRVHQLARHSPFWAENSASCRFLNNSHSESVLFSYKTFRFFTT